MKLIKQIDELKKEYLNLMDEAKKDNDTTLLNRCEGVIAALDWVKGSRSNTDDVIDFWRFKQSIIDKLNPEDFYN